MPATRTGPAVAARTLAEALEAALGHAPARHAA
jgi:hypothetical protein